MTQRSVSLLRRALSIMTLATIAGLVAPVGTQPALSQSVPISTAPTVSIEGYRTLYNGMSVGHKASGMALVYFLAGLRQSLMAAGEAYVATGAKRRFCIPPNFESVDLIDIIELELKRNAAAWDARADESIGLVVTEAVMQRWPCK